MDVPTAKDTDKSDCMDQSHKIDSMKVSSEKGLIIAFTTTELQLKNI